jgi:hypothetical protein
VKSTALLWQAFESSANCAHEHVLEPSYVYVHVDGTYVRTAEDGYRREGSRVVFAASKWFGRGSSSCRVVWLAFT